MAKKPDDAARFLDAAFGSMPDTHHLLVWTLPGRKSSWHQGAGSAARYVSALANTFDVYVGVALSSQDRGERQRGTADNVAGIVGLWADVDYLDATAHQKANLPPDEDAALHVVKAVGPTPTVLVHSGHGLQPWWLFKEPWLFDGKAERTEAAQLALRWGATMRLRAAENGWAIDSTHDLTRVLRMPGTTNNKSVPVPAAVKQWHLDATYDPSDFEQWLADDSALTLLTGRRTHHVDPGSLTLDPSATVEYERLDALFDAVGQVARKTYDRQRTDFTDQSPSSYDLALATYAVQCGWTDQEIVNLLISARRKHNDDLKLRADYYARTIAKARDQRAREMSFDELEVSTERLARTRLLRPVADIVDPTATPELPTEHEVEARNKVLDNLSTQLGIELLRIEKLRTDPTKWRIVTPTGTVLIERTQHLLEPRVMRGHILDATGVVVPLFKQTQWDRIAESMTAAAVPTDIGEEATDAGLARAWLVEYLMDRPFEPDFAVAAEAGAPHKTDDGRVFVFTVALRRWLRLHGGEKVSPQRLGDVLRSVGCLPERHDYVRPSSKKRTQASGWWLPDTIASDL